MFYAGSWRTKRIIIIQDCRYLVSNLDKQSKYNDDEQVVKDADSSDDDVDDFECEVTDVGKILRQVVIF